MKTLSFLFPLRFNSTPVAMKSLLRSFVLTAGPVLATLTCPFTGSAATKTWDGSASGLWTTAGNWAGNIAPVNGDALVFPNGPTRLLTTNSPGAATNFTSLTFTGDGYALFSSPLSLTNGMTNAGGLSAVNTLHAQVQPRASQTWDVPGRTTLILESNIGFTALTLTLEVNGALRADGNFSGGANANLVKLGNGRLDMNGPNNVLNQVRVGEGTLSVDGVFTANSLTISNGAVLAGSGTVPAFTNGGSLRIGADFGTGPGQLTVTAPGTAVFLPGSSMQVQVQGTTPGTGHDQLRVANPPNLTHGALTVLRDAAFPLSLGQKFVLITNTGAAVFTTTFTNLPQGAFITNALPPTTVFQISYAGGSGNDVELTVVSVTVTPTGVVRVWDGDGQPNLNWTNALNWAANTLPSPGDDLVFPTTVINARRLMGNAFSNGSTFNRLTFGQTNSGAWTVNGSALKLLGGIVATNGSAEFDNAFINLALELGAAQTFAATNMGLAVFGTLTLNGHQLTLVPGPAGSISLRGSNSSPGSIVMNGDGNLFLGGRTTAAAPVTLNNGTTLVFGDYSGAANWIMNGGRLDLQNGKVPGVQANGGVLVPEAPTSADKLNLVQGNLSLGGAATLEAQLLTAADKNGNPLPLLAVTGNVILNNAALAVIAPDLSQVGATFVVISNLGPNAVTGTFTGKPEGTVFAATNAQGFVFSHRISYVGGDGNDVTLTVLVPAPSGQTRVWNGNGGDPFWSVAANWDASLRPANGDAVRFPVNATQRTNDHDLPVFLDTITWEGSNYVQGGLSVLLGGLRAGHAAGTNDINGSVQVIGAQTWAVSNAPATLRLSGGGGGIETIVAAGGLGGGRSGLNGVGSVTKTGAGTLELQNIRVFLTEGLAVQEGTLRLRRVEMVGVESSSGLELHQGRVDVAEVSARSFIATAGELIVRLVQEDGTPSTQGLNARSVSLAPGVVFTVIGTNQSIETAALVCFDGSGLQIEGARLNAVLPGNLATGTQINLAVYEEGFLSGTFASLPEGGTTNFNGNVVQIRYAEVLQLGSNARFITLTVLPGPAPRFTRIEHLGTGDVILRGTASAGAVVNIEGSEDLDGFSFVGSTVANGAGQFTFIDSTGLNIRFYRAALGVP